MRISKLASAAGALALAASLGTASADPLTTQPNAVGGLVSPCGVEVPLVGNGASAPVKCASAVSAARLLGNPTGSPATQSEISLGATLNFSGTALQTGAFSGDFSSAPNSFAGTLNAVNANVGTFGSATQLGQLTVNAKGLVTGLVNVTVTPAVGSITGLGTSVAGALSAALNATGTMGAATIGSINGNTWTAGTGTLTLGSATLNAGPGGTLGTAAFQNTGTSGATIPFLNGTNTWAGVNTFSSTISGSINGNAATVTTNANLTGPVASVGNSTSIGANQITSAMLNADVFSTAHSWSGQQTFVAPVLGTPASGNLINATGLPTTGLTGTLQAAQEPAHTGDVTNTAGSLAMTRRVSQVAALT